MRKTEEALQKSQAGSAACAYYFSSPGRGRVYAVRNTFQFFTIPLGYLAGGLLVDRVFEPLMAQKSGTVK